MSTDTGWNEVGIARRPVAPPRQTPEEREAHLAEREAYRKQRRAKIKREIAEARIADKRWVELVEAIAAIDGRLVELGGEHARQVAKLQAEIATLDGEAVDKLTAGRPMDPKGDKRREALYGQIRTLEQGLEAARVSQQRLRAGLEAERIAVASKCSTSSLPSDLLELGEPALLVAYHVAESAHTWACRRAAAAADKLTRSQAPVLVAERAAAVAEVTRCKVAMDEARAAVLAE